MPYENTFYNFPFVVRNELGSIATLLISLPKRI